VAAGQKTHDLDETITKFSGGNSKEWSSNTYSSWDEQSG